VYASHNVSAGTYDDTTGVWTVGVVQVGVPQTLTLRGVIQATGIYTNTAEVTASPNFDPNSTPGNNNPAEDDQDSVTPPIAQQADLSLIKSLDMAPGGDLDGSGGYSVNDLVQFTITVTNAGPANASGVVVRDQLPSGFTYVSDDSAEAPTTAAPDSGRSAIWPTASRPRWSSPPRSMRPATTPTTHRSGPRTTPTPTAPPATTAPTKTTTTRPRCRCRT
jgi:large repetitive protein